MSDVVDEAIAQAAQPQQVRMKTVQGTVNATGRPFAVSVPEDLTSAEALAIVGMVSQLPTQLAAQRGPQLLVPRGALIAR